MTASLVDVPISIALRGCWLGKNTVGHVHGLLTHDRFFFHKNLPPLDFSIMTLAPAVKNLELGWSI